MSTVPATGAGHRTVVRMVCAMDSAGQLGPTVRGDTTWRPGAIRQAQAWRTRRMAHIRTGYLGVVAVQQAAMAAALTASHPTWASPAYAIAFAVLPRAGWVALFAIGALLALAALATGRAALYGMAAGSTMGTMAGFAVCYAVVAARGDISWLPAILAAGIVARDIIALRVPVTPPARPGRART